MPQILSSKLTFPPENFFYRPRTSSISLRLTHGWVLINSAYSTCCRGALLMLMLMLICWSWSWSSSEESRRSISIGLFRKLVLLIFCSFCQWRSRVFLNLLHSNLLSIYYKVKVIQKSQWSESIVTYRAETAPPETACAFTRSRMNAWKCFWLATNKLVHFNSFSRLLSMIVHTCYKQLLSNDYPISRRTRKKWFFLICSRCCFLFIGHKMLTVEAIVVAVNTFTVTITLSLWILLALVKGSNETTSFQDLAASMCDTCRSTWPV